MSKIKKVTIEYDDHIAFVEGEEAEKWEKHGRSVVQIAWAHLCNPFDSDPIKWGKTMKCDEEYLQDHVKAMSGIINKSPLL